MKLSESKKSPLKENTLKMKSELELLCRVRELQLHRAEIEKELNEVNVEINSRIDKVGK